MPDHSIKFRGLILVSDNYKEKDKMLTVLTGDSGVIKVCARGAAKPGSKSAVVSVPFMLCDLVVNVSHGYYYLKEGNVIENNMGIYDSLEAMASAGHISECLVDSVHQSENSREAYELSVYAFYALANSPERYKMIVSGFNWRLLYILGLNVTYDMCSACGRILDNNMNCMLSVSDGKILCSECTGNKRTSSLRQMSAAGITALNYFANCPIDSLFSGKANERLSDDLLEFTTDYLSVQFERSYDSLRDLKRKLSYDPMRRNE